MTRRVVSCDVGPPLVHPDEQGKWIRFIDVCFEPPLEDGCQNATAWFEGDDDFEDGRYWLVKHLEDQGIEASMLKELKLC